MKLDPDARMIIVRSYFLRERRRRTTRRRGAHRHRDAGRRRTAAPLDDATFAARLRAGVAFLRQTTVGQPLPGTPSPAPFMAEEPNHVGQPWSFRNAGVDAAGAVDIFYSMGRWDLGPDDALVMRGTIPPSRFTNVMLWNRHMQTLEYVHRRSSLNTKQIAYEPDGSYTIVIAHRDPGVPNWLDTGCAPHRHDLLALPAARDPTRSIATCEVVPVDSLR